MCVVDCVCAFVVYVLCLFVMCVLAFIGLF